MKILTNIVANGVARLWSALLQFLLTPVFVRLLGTDSFGLVAFYNTLLLTFIFLDWAVSPVLTREFARLTGREGAAQIMGNLLRSFEVVSWSIAFLLSVGLFAGADWIVAHWLNLGSMDEAKAVMAVRMMALVLVAQWPLSLYSAGFVALFRQSYLTVIRVCGMSVQLGGVALLLYFYEPSIILFFAWQALASGLTIIALMMTLWRIMPIAPEKPRLSLEALRRTWRFSVGNLLIGYASCLLSQADKLMVAKFTSLKVLAAYGLCFTLGLLITNLIVAPVQSVLLPRFSQFAADEQGARMAREYQLWTQILAVLALPVAAVLAGLPEQVVTLWLGKHIDLLSQMRTLLPPITFGIALSAVTFPVYCAQLAHGWVRLSVLKNVIALAVVLPVLWLFVPRYGAIVGAWCWLGVNLGYYLVEVPVMHRRILVGAMREWYLRSTLPAWGVMVAAVAAAHFLVPAGLPIAVQFCLLVGMLISVFCGLVALLPYPRALAFWLFHNRKNIWSSRSLRGMQLLDVWEAQVVSGRGLPR